MTLTLIVLLVLALYVFQLFLQETSGSRMNVGTIVGTRDEPLKLSVVASRLDRAKNNMLEALPLFLGISMLVFAKGGDMSLATNAALGFLIARVLYIPAYVSGLPWLRSLIWVAGMGCMFLMALTVI
ncbi:MAG: MAPEG family protein [Hyphomicrobiaceae bacterium]|nr:MAPEG family protein [Hyphomicrobiaceae bacterium]MCC0025100.1 MAPEG family protein [Hyphomicrobiaceae bacterium]